MDNLNMQKEKWLRSKYSTKNIIDIDKIIKIKIKIQYLNSKSDKKIISFK